MNQHPPSRWQLRRTARRMRRFGVQPTMDIATQADLGGFHAVRAVVHGLWRYRSELAPLGYGMAVYLAAGIGHASIPELWWIFPPAGILTACLLYWLGERIGLTGVLERLYAFAVALTTGLWLAAATKYAPATRPLPAVILVTGLVLAVPWWAHRRRRARVRVERTLEAWPEIAHAIGLAGSRIQSAVVDLWGWTARIALARGQTVEDAIAKAGAIESGIGSRRGAARIRPTPDNLANRAEIRVLETDPHAETLMWAGPSIDSITQPIELGLFEDGTPVHVKIKGRHVLIGGATGSGKSSGGLNVLIANLTACPDVAVWGIDLKGGMELQPWASCLDRLATTAPDAESLLAEAVARLDQRAERLAAEGKREWDPTPDDPALVVIIDEYAELVEEAPGAVKYADSIARRGRAVLVNLIVATQRPTTKTMGQGAVRSQMDVRICFRVRERRDVDLVLGQGAFKAGWHAHTLDKPGKFLISTPEHTHPDRARAYLITDQTVTETAHRHAPIRPTLPPLPPRKAQAPVDGRIVRSGSNHGMSRESAADTLWTALTEAPPEGITVAELAAITKMSEPWVYQHLRKLRTDGRVIKISRGRWHGVTSGSGNAP